MQRSKAAGSAVSPSGTKLASGELAAYLSYSVANNLYREPTSSSSTALGRLRGPQPFLDCLAAANTPVNFPKLSEGEKTSSLGRSMAYLMGLVFELAKRLSKQRREQQGTAINSANRGDHPSQRDSASLLPPSMTHSGEAGGAALLVNALRLASSQQRSIFAPKIVMNEVAWLTSNDARNVVAAQEAGGVSVLVASLQ